MIMKKALGVLALMIGPGLIGVVIGSALQPASPPPRADQGDIIELVNRLKPFVGDPDSHYEYSNGIAITFVGDQWVRVKLKMKNGDEYSGQAATLKQAAMRLTNPSDAIRKALDGWQAR